MSIPISLPHYLITSLSLSLLPHHFHEPPTIVYFYLHYLCYYYFSTSVISGG